MVLDVFCKVDALHELHHQKMRAVEFVGIVGGDDVGVGQFGGRLDLASKPLDQVGILHGRLRQDFDGHEAFHPAMLGLEHHPHASRADFVEQDVIAEDQPLRFALIKGPRLELGEFVLADQLACQVSRILRTFLLGNLCIQPVDFV